ncbi:hypothetical protein VNO77_01842 [Canavalia gladiata]|uniref:Uncharacterized protein n=1 Tax=Canavalia gladiata TaxID=3824 RepID=A0AAN9MSJ7_CANGL
MAFRFVVVTVGGDKVGPGCLYAESTVREVSEGERTEGLDWDNFVWGRQRRPEPSSFCESFLNFTSCLLQITEISLFVTVLSSLYFTSGLVTWGDSGAGICTKRLNYSCRIPGMNATFCVIYLRRLIY